MRIACALAAAGLAIVTLPAAVASQLGGSQSLLATPSVSLRVDRIAPSLSETGVTHERLDSLLFAQLDAAGIPVASAPEGAMKDGLLSLQVTYLLKSGWHVASLSLHFTRETILAADPTTKVTSVVWSRGGLVIARKKKLWAEAEASLGEMVAEFVRSYRSANPR